MRGFFWMAMSGPEIMMDKVLTLKLWIDIIMMLG